MPSFVDSFELHPNPQTPAQVRQNWARVQAQAGVDSTTLDNHETRLDNLDGGPQSAIFDAAASAGAPVYVTSGGHVGLADADAVATADVVGLAIAAVSNGATGTYQSDGFVTLSDWTAIVGAATLTAGARYLLSGTAGQLTTTAPTSVGQVVVLVGIAVTTTKLQLCIDDGTLL
jgi:hypothetical protein